MQIPLITSISNLISSRSFPILTWNAYARSVTIYNVVSHDHYFISIAPMPREREKRVIDVSDLSCQYGNFVIHFFLHLHNSIQCTSVYHSRCSLIVLERHRNVNHFLPFGSCGQRRMCNVHCIVASISFHFCLKIILLLQLQCASIKFFMNLNMPSIPLSQFINSFYICNLSLTLIKIACKKMTSLRWVNICHGTRRHDFID